MTPSICKSTCYRRLRVENLPEELVEGEAGQLTAGPVTHTAAEQRVCGAGDDIIGFGGTEKVGDDREGEGGRVRERGCHYFKKHSCQTGCRKNASNIKKKEDEEVMLFSLFTKRRVSAQSKLNNCSLLIGRRGAVLTFFSLSRSRVAQQQTNTPGGLKNKLYGSNQSRQDREKDAGDNDEDLDYVGEDCDRRDVAVKENDGDVDGEESDDGSDDDHHHATVILSSYFSVESWATFDL